MIFHNHLVNTKNAGKENNSLFYFILIGLDIDPILILIILLPTACEISPTKDSDICHWARISTRVKWQHKDSNSHRMSELKELSSG